MEIKFHNFQLKFFFYIFTLRIGRSGRFGRKGLAINLITDDEIKYLKDIESFYNTTISEMKEKAP